MKLAFTLFLVALMILPAAIVVRLRVNRARRDMTDRLKSSTEKDEQQLVS